jgi:hypothetical protein
MIENLLSKLDGVHQNGQGKWMAICPAHSDTKPSLAIRLTDDGKALLHCFAGCGVHDVVAALGLSLADLFPKTSSFDHSKKQRPDRVINASDGLRLIEYEAGVLQVCANDMERCMRTGERLHPNTPMAITNALRAIRGVAREAFR